MKNINEQLSDQPIHQLYSQICNPLRSQICRQPNELIYNQLYNKIDSGNYWQLHNQLKSNTKL